MGLKLFVYLVIKYYQGGKVYNHFYDKRYSKINLSYKFTNIVINLFILLMYFAGNLRIYKIKKNQRKSSVLKLI